MSKYIAVIVIFATLCIGNNGSLAAQLPKILSMEGDTLSSSESYLVVYDLSIRYMIFVIERNKGKSDPYCIRLKNENSKYCDPPIELLNRLSDLEYEFIANSKYEAIKNTRNSDGKLLGPGSRISIQYHKYSSKRIWVSLGQFEGFSQGISLGFEINWKNGIWMIEEPDGIGF